MKNKAVAIIHDEHRALGAVVHGLLHFAQRASAGDEPDYKLLWTMIRYIAEFPQTLHHPKEERLMFAALAKCTHAADDVIRHTGKRAIPQFVLNGRWVQPYRPGRGFLYEEMSELLGISRN